MTASARHRLRGPFGLTRVSRISNRRNREYLSNRRTNRIAYCWRPRSPGTRAIKNNKVRHHRFRPAVQLAKGIFFELTSITRPETLIVWTEQNGTDMALSFQEAEGCAVIW